MYVGSEEWKLDTDTARLSLYDTGVYSFSEDCDRMIGIPL